MYEWLKQPKAALLVMLLYAVSPWGIYFGRMAHETNLMTLLILLGIYCLFKIRSRNYFHIAAAVFFALSLYTYHTARVFVPLFLILFTIVFWKEINKKPKLYIVGLLLLVILALPLANELRGEGFSRIRTTSFWSDPGLIPKVNEQRGQAIARGMSPVLAKLLYSKVTAYPSTFADNFLRHFSASFLLTNGDPNGVYNVPNSGILLWVEPILLLVGLWYLWHKERRLFCLFIGAIVISLIPDSLTRLSPSSARIHIALPFVIAVSGVGFWRLLNRRWLTLLCAGLVVTNSYWFWYNYVTVLPVQNARAWQIGTKALITTVQQISPHYDEVWMSRECWGWIHLVFHTKYDPAVLQKEIKPSAKNDLGFWWVSDIGKYHLEWFPKELTTTRNRLYVGLPSEFPKGTTPISVIKHPTTQQELFWLVDSHLFDVPVKNNEMNPQEGYL
jgi:hypothetical protein